MEEHEINIFWKKIVNTINDGLMFIGPDGAILMVNKAFECLTGYSSKETIGMSCRILGCDACEQTLDTGTNAVWCKLFAPGQEDMKKCRCLIKKKDGSLLPVLKNASVLKDEQQNILGVVETLTDISELERLDEKVHILSRHCHRESDFFGMVGKSRKMEEVFDMIRRASDTSAPVIIQGESGTGKELVANAIHLCGARKDGPFIQLNCAALNPFVLESEMFGHVKGAFTGAYTSRIGRFEAANRGDFFLDEIGDMPMSLQTKLLRVLESGWFERVGDITPIRVNVRIITATNKDLDVLIQKDEFRQDLFFRINVIPIRIPALRERKEDIPLLVNAFMAGLNQTSEKKATGVSNAAMDLFMDYSWPGNVRELKNAMEYAFVTTAQPVIQPEHLPRQMLGSKIYQRKCSRPESGRHPDERQALIDALRQTDGNQTRAARLLNVNRVTVWNRMKKYGIDVKKIFIS